MGIIRRSFSSAKTAVRQADQLQRLELNQSHLANGLTIATLDNLSPVARVAVYVRAGAKHENGDNTGVTHKLRYAAGMTTQNSTIFGITRNIEYVGGSLVAETTRDDVIYRLNNLRDLTQDNFKYLAETVTRPAFKPWQLNDYKHRIVTEIKRSKDNPQIVLLENLHRVAFRGGLANSLYCPSRRAAKMDSNELKAYVSQHYKPSNMVVVGVGVDHSALEKAVTDMFTMDTSGSKPSPVKSKFKGGEARLSRDIGVALVAVASEGVSAVNIKDVLTLQLFESLLESGSVTYTPGSGRLSQALSNTLKNPFVVRTLNVSYAESGLFGLTLACHPSESETAVRTAVSKLRETAKGLKEEDVASAKHRLQAKLLLARENPDVVVDHIATQCLNQGKALTGKELCDLVQSISLQDVSSLASKITKSKGALVSVGAIDNVPYLEDLA